MSSEHFAPDPARVLRILWFRKWHILVCAFVFGFAAFVVTARQPEQFSAQANILLDPRKNNVVLSTDQIVSDLEFTNATVESEVARIASLARVEEVVRDMGHDRLAFLDTGSARAGGLVGRIDQLKGILAPERPMQHQLPATEDRSLQRVIFAIARGVQAQRAGNSFVISLRVTTRDPIVSAEIANQLAERYIAEQVEERRDIALTASKWHANQLAKRRSEMAAADQRVQALKHQNLAQTGANTEVLSMQLAELARVHAEAQSNLAASQSRSKSLTDDLLQNGYRAVAEAQTTPVFVGLMAEEEALLIERRTLAETFGERHPARQANAYKVQRIDARIAAAVENLVKAGRTEIAELEVLEAALRHDLHALQSTILEADAAAQLLRQREIEAISAREGYEQLVSRLAEIRAQSDLQLSDARVLNLAQIPTGPSAPRPKFMGLIGACVGASFGFFAVLALEGLGRGISSREELQMLTEQSVTSVLPMDHLGTAGDVLSRLTEPHFAPIAERLRQLQTVLEHKEPSGCQLILVTSARRAEGRSTVAIALSYLSSETAQKTLLVSSNEWALSEANSESAALAHGGRRDIRSAGEFLDCWTPGEANHGSWYTAIDLQLDELRQTYDLVVLDGPPLLVQSDALQLAGLADQITFVVSAMQTPRRAVASCLSLLSSVGTVPSAWVLNKADQRLDPDLL